MKNIIKEKILLNQNKNFKEIRFRQSTIPENTNKIIAIIGPRRSGKSSFLFAYIKKLLIKKQITRKQILFFNFEDERLNLSKEDLHLIIDSYRELYPEISQSEIFCFFDEIQNIEGWESFIRRLNDEGFTKIFVTGSNAKLLSQEIATSMRGRAISREILPLNFQEYLQFKDDAELSPYLPNEKAKILNHFDTYLKWGGFPEIINYNEETKLQTLQEYFEVMIFSDIIERYKISDVSLLKNFMKRLIQTATKEFSINKIQNELRSMGYKFDKNVLYQFLEYIQNIYFGKVIEKFDFSVKKQYLIKKFYPIDNGFLNALSFSFSKNYGKLIENLVFQHLNAKHSNKVFFIKNGLDIDFIVNEEEKTIFQVCYEMTENNRKRELESLKQAMKKFKTKTGYCITRDQNKTTTNKNIKIIEFWRWAGGFKK